MLDSLLNTKHLIQGSCVIFVALYVHRGHCYYSILNHDERERRDNGLGHLREITVYKGQGSACYEKIIQAFVYAKKML